MYWTYAVIVCHFLFSGNTYVGTHNCCYLSAYFYSKLQLGIYVTVLYPSIFADSRSRKEDSVFVTQECSSGGL
jgi:hypothetical protein